jgi:Pyrimidine dimer DNA glycosylase
MQTFTPYPNFEESLRALDLKRLGKQRVEVIQIVRALTVPGYAWSSHPAVLMWQGYEEALGRYGLTACEVWIERGFGDSCAATITADLRAAGIAEIGSYKELAASDALPSWLFDERVQLSHRSSLLRKDPEHYGPLFPPDTPRDRPVARRGPRLAQSFDEDRKESVCETPIAGRSPVVAAMRRVFESAPRHVDHQVLRSGIASGHPLRREAQGSGTA